MGEGSAEENKKDDEAEPSAGYRLLADLGVNGTSRSKWAETVTAALEMLGPEAVGIQLAGGATRPGPGAIVKTRLPDLTEQLVQARQTPNQQDTGTSSAWPDWCGVCEHDDRRYENDNGVVVKCPACHPYANRSTVIEDKAFLDKLAQMTGDAA